MQERRAYSHPSQYMLNACDGLGTVGDVCPAVLPVAGRRLEGFGFNPSVVAAPSSLRHAAGESFPTLRYVGTARIFDKNFG